KNSTPGRWHRPGVLFFLLWMHFALEIHYDDFRVVEHPEREPAVAEPPADHDTRTVFRMDPFRIFWQYPLVRCVEPFDKGQSDLPPVCMTGEHKINRKPAVQANLIRSVRHQQGQPVILVLQPLPE